jgi:hypothetical protein
VHGVSYTLGPGTASCLDEEGFRDTVAAKLDGSDIFTPDGAMRVAVTLTRGRGGFKGEVTIHDGEGRSHGREQPEARTCGELVNDIAITLAMALSPFREERAPAPAPAAEPAQAPLEPPPTPPTPQRASAAPPRAAPRAARRASAPVAPSTPPRLVLGAGLGMAEGFTPDFSVGFSGLVGVRWPATFLLVEARDDLPGSSVVRDGATFESSWFGGSVAVCHHQALFFGCGLVTAGSGRTLGLSDRLPRTRTYSYAGVGLRAGVEVPLSSRLAGQLSVDLLVNVDPRRLRLRQGDVWSAPRLSQAMTLRLVAFF